MNQRTGEEEGESGRGWGGSHKSGLYPASKGCHGKALSCSDCQRSTALQNVSEVIFIGCILFCLIAFAPYNTH